jgi:hypothetical protein
MTKKLIVLSALMLMTTYQGFVVSDALAADGGFTTMWAIDLPRGTYFIGESVTFTVIAFASTDVTLMLPDQMAKITIRNESMAEVYDAWVTTNANGSAPVTWETGLEATTGNYTIILDDLKGTKVIGNFVLLYNEETFWQTRVDLIEKELQSQYNYINYLFSYNKFLEQRVRWIDQQFKLLWAMSFVTIMCGVYVAMHEFAMSGRSSSGIMSYPGKLLELLGFRKKPIVELDHEIIADAKVPPHKRVPIYGHTHFCPICDPEKLQPMTESMLRDHLWAKHDRLHLKKDSISAKWRARKHEKAVKVRMKAEEPPKPAFASVEKYQQEWTEEVTRERFQTRLNLVKMRLKKKLITSDQARTEISKIRADLESAKKKTLVFKETSAPKVESPRKVRTEKQLSGIPKKPIILDNNPLSIASYLEDHPDSELDREPKKTAIDELFEKLNHEKVN